MLSNLDEEVGCDFNGRIAFRRLQETHPVGHSLSPANHLLDAASSPIRIPSLLETCLQNWACVKESTRHIEQGEKLCFHGKAEHEA